MIDVVGIVIHAWVAVATPQPVQTVPLVGQASAGSSATTASATSVLNEVEKLYGGTKQLTATFAQIVTYKAFGKPAQSSGKVYLAKPGKMRWDYSDKKGKGTKTSFISNGTYLYVVEYLNKQVIKKNIKNDLMPVAVTFLHGKGSLSSEFNAQLDTTSTFGTKDDIVVKLTPKKPSAQYKTLHLVVAKDNYRVRSSIVTDVSDNTTEYRFYKPDFEKPVDSKWFEFDPSSVKHYRIIDADQQVPAQPGKK